MTDERSPKPGFIGWVDLTVPEAERLRDFYASVVGWRPQGVDMGEYEDWNMLLPNEDRPTAGICHARGINAALPPVWMIYLVVEDLDRSIERVRSLGGELVMEPRSMGTSRYCVIRDPAGAVCALYQH
jgi:predicted enzyme related to lactoylglutathione lyase